MTVSTGSGQATNWRLQTARWISILLHPICQVYFVLVLVGAKFGVRGVLLGLLAATLAAGIPGLTLWRFVRSGHVADMDVSQRHQRPVILGLSLVSLVLGFVVLVPLHAPSVMLRVLVAMGAGLVVAAAVSKLWKISIHAAVTAGAVMALGLVVSPWLFLLAPLGVAVAVSRVVLGAHTVWQVLVGLLVGALVSTSLLV